MYNKTIMLRTVAIVGALSVILGAFGAHALKSILLEKQLTTYHTGISYQFYHVLAMFGCYALYLLTHKSSFVRAFWLFFFGILFFCGSLYLLASQDILGIPLSWLGPITPIGGLLFIMGWISLLFKHKTNK